MRRRLWQFGRRCAINAGIHRSASLKITPNTSSRRRLLAPALPLTLGLAGGYAASLVGMPLAWMLGPMILNTIVALAGFRLTVPSELRLLMVPVIGVMLGSGIHPHVITAAIQWWPGVLLLPPFLFCAGAAAYFTLRRLGNYDPTSAYFAALPGGLNESLILGEAAGGDVRRIALAHATRILVVVFAIAMFFFVAFGVRGSGGASSGWVALDAPTVFEYAVMIVAGVLGTWGALRLGLPAAPVLGPMILSGLAHGTNVIEIGPPGLIVLAAQMLIGTTIGCRFSGAKLGDVGRDLVVATLAALAMLAVTVAFAGALMALAGVNIAAAFLAYSPGGLAEMSLIALSMGQDIAYVSVMHIVRIAVVVAGASLLFKRLIGIR